MRGVSIRTLRESQERPLSATPDSIGLLDDVEFVMSSNQCPAGGRRSDERLAFFVVELFEALKRLAAFESKPFVVRTSAIIGSKFESNGSHNI